MMQQSLVCDRMIKYYKTMIKYRIPLGKILCYNDKKL